MKNREQTEEKILEAVGSIIENQGFEKVGINAIATEAGVSKMLIYRYFGGIEELIAQYLIQKDYWANTDAAIINPEAVGDSIKSMFRRQVEQLRNDITLRRLYRWELFTDNQNIRQLRNRREENGCRLIKMVSALTGCPDAQVAALASILSASISYLALLEGQCQSYNDICLQTDEGWNQLMQGIEMIIDLWIKHIRK
ncbi:TetR/AcrR family transcriptional regulator [Segatella oulorum]|uniref:TetR/AcrR family transcriptional regulator n=1 Tax=Segatella oulorum TaxID=28136 RepID=UPI0028E4ACBA|nr:TetR/AcrR family transcriptional regulator [Segatella oulorum]